MMQEPRIRFPAIFRRRWGSRERVRRWAAPAAKPREEGRGQGEARGDTECVAPVPRLAGKITPGRARRSGGSPPRRASGREFCLRSSTGTPHALAADVSSRWIRAALWTVAILAPGGLMLVPL